MKTGAIIGVIAAVIAVGFGIYMIDVDMTDEGSMPEVDVSVQEGEMPEFDVETGDVEVGTAEVDVTVPTIDVEAPADDQVAENN